MQYLLIALTYGINVYIPAQICVLMKTDCVIGKENSTTNSWHFKINV